jgi:hypothetical protein
MFEIKELLPENFSSQSKVWIYQSSRLFSMQEAFTLEDMFQNFLNSWQSHGASVKGYANLFFGRFIILMADESQTTVGGCSTDSSVRLIKQVEEIFNVNMFDRQQLAFYIKDKIEILPYSQLQYAYNNNFINNETLFFNNLVSTKKDLEEKWISPLYKTWLASKINAMVN